MQGHQRFAIGRAEETLACDNQTVRASNWNIESPRDPQVHRTEHDDPGWSLYVGVDVFGRGIINSPARSTRKRNRRDHPHLINLNHRYGAVHARRITDTKHEKVVPDWVVRQSIRTL